MTDREKAIVMAYTGAVMLVGDKFSIYHKYIEDICGRPIYTHEIAFLAEEIKEKSRADFIELCREETHECDCISREAIENKLKSLVNEMETIFADIRESKVDDSVCGLCEYDCDHGIDGFANECPGFERDDCFKLKDEYRKEWESIEDLPSVQPKTDIDSFVDFLITENCEGCTECEPRLPGDKSFACCEEGRAKWFMEMAKKFKEREK